MKPPRQNTRALLILLVVLAANAVAMWRELAFSRADLNDNVLQAWVRYLAVVLLPLSFWGLALRLDLPRLTAAAAALLAPMISTNLLYGIEYGSFTWAGSGSFPQAVAIHLMLAALGAGWAAIRRGRQVILTGVLVGLTALAHLIYGYMALLSIVLLAVLPHLESARSERVRRAALVALTAVLLSAFQVAPLLLDGATVNHSRSEPQWKWDSYGAGTVLEWAVTGKLLDFERLPVLSLLAAAGAVICIRKMLRREWSGAHAFAAGGALFWLLFYFGRPFWGPLLTMLGALRDMHLDRVIGGLHVFLVLLGAIGLCGMWHVIAMRRGAGWAALATVILLYPAVKERIHVLKRDAARARESLALREAERDALSATLTTLRARGGRTYAMPGSGWGAGSRAGTEPFYAALSRAQLPSPGFQLDLAFDSNRPDHYRLFNIHNVAAPEPAAAPLPDFLKPVERSGRYRLLDAPGSGYFDVVDVTAAVTTTRNSFEEINNRWLRSDWPAKRAHLWLDWNGDAPPGKMRVYPYNDLPTVPAMFPPPGSVTREDQSGETYRAELTAARPSYALFKMTWHRNWKAYVDGREAPVTMLSPGFPGVAIPSGRHRIEMRYEPGQLKGTLAVAGWIGLGILALWGSRLRLPAFRSAPLKTALGVALLAMPICLPLFTSSLIWGHDAFSYFPRVVEVHQNFTNGIFLPRWAPDLGSGTGQPLFLYHPPLFYWLAEFWYLLGFPLVTSVNLACAVVVLVSAAGMFLFGRLYFGNAGAWLSTAAYLYAPYFATDLYIRSALEEFTAFALFPLALYGFGAYARYRNRRCLALGACAYAGVVLSHLPATMLFTPLLLGFLALTAWMEKSWRVFSTQAAGFLLGLGLSACVWLPAALERNELLLTRAIEGYASYRIHFVYGKQLLYSPWGYGTSVEGPADGMPFSVGWSHLLVLLAAVWVARRGTRTVRSMVWVFGAATAFYCLLMLNGAAPVWSVIVPLQYVQLPWRLLGPVTLGIAVAAGALAGTGRWVAGVALALLIAPNLSHLRAGSTQDLDPSFWTPRELAHAGFETTMLREMTPRWVENSPPYSPDAVRQVSGTVTVKELARTPFSWTGRVSAEGPGAMVMNLAYFPGWNVEIDGRPASFGPAPSTGLISFGVSQGEHRVEVWWGTAPPRQRGERISLASLAIVLALLYRRKVKQP